MDKYSKLDYKTIGERIKYLRGTASQSEFGRKFNRPYIDIGRVERGEVKPTVELLFNICTECNVTFDWLLTGEGPIRKERATGFFEPEPPQNSAVVEKGFSLPFRPEKERIGNIMVRKGLIKSEDLEVALIEQSAMPIEEDEELIHIIGILRHELPEAKKAILKILKYRREAKEGIKSLLSLDDLFLKGDMIKGQ
jgi:transcriptional regulator with XRE-family HTH domain